ncbi:MAG: methyltransferase domain-containing protein [Pseudomonadota bacterium]
MEDGLTEDALDRLAEAYDRGLACERAGDPEGAAAAFRDCLMIDPDDRGGASVRLAALGAGPAPERAPPAYVATLFDQHADSFEMTLVMSLGYAVPERIAETLAALAPGDPPRFARVLDLGCGTGLVGEALGEMAAEIEGIDLSEGMLDVADEKEIYAGFHIGDAVAFLEQADGVAWDLIVAADVLPYLGAVEPLFNAVALRLAPGGLFAFSTEALPAEAQEGQVWAVGPKQRYGHDPDQLVALLDARGLVLRHIEAVTVRYESGVPAAGHLIVAGRSVA